MWRKQWVRALPVLGVLIVMQGCISGKELQDRHSMSRLYTAEDGSTLVFEASVSPDYPPDDEHAEAVRQSWISQWLELRRLCLNGYTVIDRVALGSASDNPYRHNLRYTLRCSAAP